MSAETLRRAARLMRSNAERATAGSWTVSSQYGRVDVFRHPYSPGDEMVAERVDAYDAEHIASWHPAVALAVADQLDEQAAFYESAERAAASGQDVGACDQCVLEMRCCNSGDCWCCDAPTIRSALVELLARRPDLRGALPLRPLGDVLAEGALWNA